MVHVDLNKLFDRLSPLSSRTLELAIATCVKRTNYNVELEHWLMVLGDSSDSDYVRILESFEVDFSRLKEDLTKNLDRLKTGNAKSPSLSPDVVELATEAWTMATINYSAGQVRSGHLLLALLSNDSFRRSAVSASRQFEKINSEALSKSILEICADTAEDRDSTNLASQANTSTASGGVAAKRNTPSLDQFTIDLTARAREGKIDAVLGRGYRDTSGYRHLNATSSE